MLSKLEGAVMDGRINVAWAIYHQSKHYLSLEIRSIIRGAIIARTKEMQGETLSHQRELAKESFYALFKEVK